MRFMQWLFGTSGDTGGIGQFSSHNYQLSQKGSSMTTNTRIPFNRPTILFTYTPTGTDEVALAFSVQAFAPIDSTTPANPNAVATTDASFSAPDPVTGVVTLGIQPIGVEATLQITVIEGGPDGFSKPFQVDLIRPDDTGGTGTFA
jgi:hypothetical protein